MKSTAERSIEALTWASIVIWLGFALVAHILNYVWLVVMILGIILLSSAIYQRSQGWHTSLSIWVFGIWMAVFSVVETVSAVLGSFDNGGLTIDLWVYLGIALVSMGVAVVLRSVQGPALTASLSREASDDRAAYDRDAMRGSAPRRVNEDNSAGYIPPPGVSGRYPDDRSQPQYSRQADPYAQQPQYGGQTDPYAQPPQYDRSQTDPYNEPSQYGRQPDSRSQPVDSYNQRQEPYDQPAQYDAQGYAPDPQAPQQDYYYEQPGQPQDGYAPGWDQPAPQARPPAAGPRRRTQQRGRQRTAQPASEPSDLESRVEDIIRRSRERRDQPPDQELPY